MGAKKYKFPFLLCVGPLSSVHALQSSLAYLEDLCHEHCEDGDAAELDHEEEAARDGEGLEEGQREDVVQLLTETVNLQIVECVHEKCVFLTQFTATHPFDGGKYRVFINYCVFP